MDGKAGSGEAPGAGIAEEWATAIAVYLMGALVGGLALTGFELKTAAEVLGACGTLLVAVGALAVSKRAATIAAHQLEHERRQSSEQARILGRLLLNEVTAAPGAIARVVRALSAGREQNNGTAYARGFEWAGEVLLPAAEKSVERIHHFPDAIGADLATLIGTFQLLRSRVKETASKYRFDPPRHGPLFAGSWSEVDDLIGQLKTCGIMAAQFATELATHVGAAGLDYEPVLIDLRRGPPHIPSPTTTEIVRDGHVLALSAEERRTDHGVPYWRAGWKFQNRQTGELVEGETVAMHGSEDDAVRAAKVIAHDMGWGES